MTLLDVNVDGKLTFLGRSFACALGRGGRLADKREGDGATPVGEFPLLRVLYRPDRLHRPQTRLPVAALERHHGWCDAPDDPAYNLPVDLPYPASAERLWRADHLYDLIVIIGFNDRPVVANRGSAIFLHLARPGFAPTEGCIALELEPLLEIMAACGPESRLKIQPELAPAGG